MNRRALLSSTALALPAAVAVAGCTWLEQVTGTTTPQAAMQAILNNVGFVLPLLDALAVGLSVAVPAAAPALGAAVAILNNDAAPIFQRVVATMTQVQAQPLVKQIEGYVSAAFSSIQTVVSATPSLSSNAAVQTRLAQAQTVLGLLEDFVNGVTTPALSARFGHPTVPLPLVHG